LIICSVGIAFALLGTIFVFAASQHGATAEGSLNISALVSAAPKLNYALLRLGFIFCFLGYGTKAGVFPLHNWLPDAHSEAPAPASAILSGSLLNCSLFGIYQISQIVIASQHRSLTYDLIGVMGGATVLAAGLLLIRQHSFKRLWAYSSIENVGIMLVAIALGSGSLFFLQALNHSLAKVGLFLITGSITQAAGSKRLNNLHGIIKSSPLWGLLLALGTFAVTGAPPFGAFVSEMAILTSTAQPSSWPIAVMLLAGIAIAFLAVCMHVGKILAGNPRPDFKAFATIRASFMPSILVAGSLALGLFLAPSFFTSLP
jgi:hydrogenase-4 component F